MRIIEETIIGQDKKYATIYGLSTDTKPVEEFIMGSVFVEVDTGKAYLYNESTEAWVEQ